MENWNIPVFHIFITFMDFEPENKIFNQTTCSMGKGDIKTKRGKIVRGTYGVRRKREKRKETVMAVKAKEAKAKAKEEAEAKVKEETEAKARGKS